MIISDFTLQLFADGANGGTAAGAAGAGVTAAAAGQDGTDTDVSTVIYGKADPQTKEDASPQSAAADLDKEFENLIKGKYKEQYGKRMQKTVQSRLGTAKDAEAKLAALSPIMEHFYGHYGVENGKLDDLVTAFENDEKLVEEEALEKGVTPKQLLEFKRMERENKELAKQLNDRKQAEAAEKIYAQWNEEAEKVKAYYPAFDMAKEIENPGFQQLLKAGVGVQTAYEVVHKDEIIPAAMQVATKKAAENVAASVAANARRPAENGLSGASPSLFKTDHSKLTSADMKEIRRRVEAGEKISF